MKQQAKGQVQESEIGAVVIRCQCGQPETHANEPCPAGAQENLGTISYYHADFLARLFWRLWRWRVKGQMPARSIHRFAFERRATLTALTGATVAFDSPKNADPIYLQTGDSICIDVNITIDPE